MNANASWIRIGIALALALCAFAPSAGAATTSTDQVSVYATTPTATESPTPGAGQFTFVRTGSTGALTVNYTVGGSATPGVDYTALPGSIVIPDTQTTATVAVTPIDDGAIEGAETVDVTITPNASYIVSAAFVAEVLIADDDLTASIQVPRVVCTEPFASVGGQPYDEAGAAVFRAQLNAPFSGTALGRFTVDFGGGATVDSDYQLFYVLGKDLATSFGTMKDAGRRALNGTASIVGGWGLTTSVFDGTGTVIAFKGNQLTFSSGLSRSGTGIFRAGDIIAIGGQTFYLATAAASGANFDVTVIPISPSALPTQFTKLAAIDTAIAISGASRWQFSGLQGYDHIEFEIAPKNDVLVEGAESVTCLLEASPDFTLVDPTVGTTYIADTTSLMSIALTSNAIEGSTNGVATISTTGPFPFNITIPYVVSGSANYAVNKPNAAAPADYTIAGLDITTGVGLVTLPAGQTSVQVTVVPIVDALTETVETVTISLVSSLDYALAGSSSSSVNPSATINIGDPGSGVVIIPPGTTTGTSTTTGGSGTSTTGGTTTSTVRPLPTNSSSNSCGLGSGLAGVLLALGTLIRFAVRRRA